MTREYINIVQAIATKLLHITWSTKYRRPIVNTGSLREVVDRSIRDAALRHNINIIELNVQPEHVHVLAEVPSEATESHVVQLLKGASSHTIGEIEPRLFEGGHLWAQGANRRVVPESELAVVSNYIKCQDERHGTVWN